jgi:response regulator RpfG family c-di-GMP phosphodiesterase
LRGGLQNNHMTQLTHEGNASGATVLIVEDEIVVSFFIQTLLEERGLPDTSGDQLVAPIRAVLPELPIVIATGFSESEFGRRFQDDARVRVIGKPFDAPQLWSALGTLDSSFETGRA